MFMIMIMIMIMNMIPFGVNITFRVPTRQCRKTRCVTVTVSVMTGQIWISAVSCRVMKDKHHVVKEQR